nr:immunoglobulin heavy chain junction region [Macaca mulatta]
CVRRGIQWVQFRYYFDCW